MRPAQSSRASWLLSIAILALSLGCLAPGAYREINVYDEGVAAYGAERVTAGEVPYRDFWTIYAPGDLYLLAALFKAFGPRLIVERHAWVLGEGILALLVFSIARRVGDRTWAVLCWSLTILWTRQLPFFGSPVIPSLVCCCAAALATLAFVDRPRSAGARDARAPAAGLGLLVLTGALVAACALFRQDFGLYACLGIVATLMLASQAPAHDVIVFLAAMAIALAPALIALLIAVPADRLVEHLIVFPLETYPRTRALPLPSLPASPFGLLTGDVSLGTWLRDQARVWQFYGSIVILSAVIFWTLWSLVVSRRQRSDSSACSPSLPPWHTAFLVGAIGLLMVNHARVRSDIFHLYPAFLFATIAWVSLMAATSRWRVAWPYKTITTVTALFVTVVALLAARSERLAESRQTPFVTERAAGLFTLHPAEADAYQRAIAYVQHVVPPDQPIFVGTSHHDRIVVNDVLFYFLSERRSATRYHDLHPGVATTASVQEAIVQELEGRHVSCVVLGDDVHAPEPSNESSRSSGVTILDRYIAEHFRAGPRFAEYQVYARADAPPGSPR